MESGGPRLELQDGTSFSGEPFGAWGSIAGEVVFNTGMVGYPESLTDPSYRGQILVLTYPLVGNYGVPAWDRDDLGLPLGFESDRIQVAGLVVSRLSRDYSHHDAARSLHDWMDEEGIPGLTGVDTRTLTKRLRARGVMPGRFADDGTPVAFEDPNEREMVCEVAVEEPRVLNPGAGPRVVVQDAGVKTSILRSLAARGLEVVRLPYTHDPLEWEPVAMFAGNGPGDPELCPQAVEGVRVALETELPVMGICLGCQLLGLAAGGRTFKLTYGHRSQNQPALEVGTDRCLITSQNHGYAVDIESLPGEWDVWFTNANDGTLEGIRREDGLAYAVQFHPEARPGPTDSDHLFDEFAKLVRERARRQGGGAGGA
jgi:carbamoyl-phosphate synthase small subunit